MTENIKALVRYRIDQADESLEAAKILLEKGLLRQTVNRSYYAMFYAVLALLATRKMETSKHSGAIALFDKEFIKQGIFAKDFSRWLHKAFDLRQEADYKADYQVTKEISDITLENTVTFLKEVKTVLAKIIG
ncbi:MAG: hypothetical protein BWK80_24325 [Desulfobacteraceae bacterium IS3]|nr:MAG: hypothetical protein BWK80_24325 [Desulfobacteraceae bacterium IS3]